ncbi:MAG: sigma-70 family RNA polymerase sigma factor [Fusobacteriaceae bacterium]
MISETTIKEAQFGNMEAMEKIFSTYKRFIFTKTRDYFLYGADKEDLIQEGMIGLSKAIYAFDSNKNASFNTFAALCIKRQIVSAIKSHNAGKNRFLNEAQTAHTENGSYNYVGRNSSFDNYNPEEIFLCKEKLEKLMEYRVENFSLLENKVFEQMVLGKTYIEISLILDRPSKNIDNAMQRIKKKFRDFELEYFKTK